MPEPILERIALSLEHALRQVRRSAGWNSDFTVERAKGSGNIDREGLVVIFQADPHGIAGANRHKTWMQPFLLRCTVIADERYSDPVDRRLNFMVADAQKAVRLDQQRGGLALNTQIPDDDPIHYEPADNVTDAILRIEVSYRTLIDDPYSQ